nr:immunoglobulin light chain junction region [Macaca mulatta]
SHHYYSTPHSF